MFYFYKYFNLKTMHIKIINIFLIYVLSIKNIQSTNLEHVISLLTQAALEESSIPTPNKQTLQESQSHT